MYIKNIYIKLVNNKSILFDCRTLVIIKEEKFTFNLQKIYRIKENKFFILTETKDTFIMEVQNILSNTTDSSYQEYQEIRYRIIKHTFNINKAFNDETIYSLFNNEDFVFHNLNHTLKVSSLDSVEELTEFSSIAPESKFKIIFLDKIFINEEEFLIVVYKDLTCEIFTYARKVREIKRYKKFMIMIEDEFLYMNYAVIDSLLIGYVENSLHILDLKRFSVNSEKFVDKTIELSNIFGKNSKTLPFTNYFLDNFPDHCKHFFNIINTSQNKLGLDYLNDTDRSELKINKNFKNFKVTASIIYSNPHNNSIYYIIGTNTGKVAIIDIFFSESLTINPLILIDYHSSKITYLKIIENKLLIICSEDGVITFTDISKDKLTYKQSVLFDNLDNIKVKDIMNDNEISTLNMNYYYSKRKASLHTQSTFPDHMFLSQKILHHEEPQDESLRKVITLVPSYTFKNYHRLKRTLTVTQLDISTACLDDNIRKKCLIGLELEDNSIMIIEVDSINNTVKKVYTFNINSQKNSTIAIYHISHQKCLIIYLENNTVRVCNYSSKTADRIVTDIKKIHSMLMVEDKLKVYFSNSDNIFTNDFKVKYEEKEGNNSIKNSSDTKYSELSTGLNSYSNTISVNSFSNTNSSPKKKSDRDFIPNHVSNTSVSSSNFNISLEFIRDYLTDETHRKFFMNKYIQNAFNKRKIHLNITQNKFESTWIKRIENLIIDYIFEIINSNLNDDLKRIKILNILFNPSKHNTIFDRYKQNQNGIESNTLIMGNQINEYLSINFEDYFSFIEKLVNENKNNNGSGISNRINYYNFISLFHIWNLSLDLDILMLNILRIYQPIFEFNFLLKGYDSAISLILNREVETDGEFNDHFNFFTEYLKVDGATAKTMKMEKYFNKSYILKSQQGYIVNLKNHKISSNISHLLNLSFFGSMVAVLGFEESNDICRLISTEKSILKSLAQQKYTLNSNLYSIDKYMYETIDDILLPNKDLILVEYLSIKINYVSKCGNINSIRTKFREKLNFILNYLDSIYMYIFCFSKKEEIFTNFYKMNKDKNIEIVKLNFLCEFELSLINIVIVYNCIVDDNNKLEELEMLKITQLLVLFCFKVLNPIYSNFKTSFSKIIIELLAKCSEFLEKIYIENVMNYAKFLIDLYTGVRIPIDLDGLFKKYEIGHCMIIKSEDNYNFLKIMLAKHLKNFSKNHISIIIKIIVEEYKKKNLEFDYFSYLLEILWILFREKNPKHVNFLPPLINLIMNSMSPQNKDLRNNCLDNAKKVLSCLLPNYPMIGFHQNSQRLAVGANDGKIYIYDLTSGNIWKNLNAHTNEITAISFDFTGNIIMSYSSTENTVKFWKIGLTNFFSNFFSMKDGYYKSLKFPVIRNEIKPEDKVNIVKFQLMQKHDNKVILIREDKSVEVLDL